MADRSALVDENYRRLQGYREDIDRIRTLVIAMAAACNDIHRLAFVLEEFEYEIEPERLSEILNRLEAR